MQQSFHVYVRQHANNWWTASVLTHPEYAVFGPSLHPLKEELKVGRGPTPWNLGRPPHTHKHTHRDAPHCRVCMALAWTS